MSSALNKRQPKAKEGMSYAMSKKSKCLVNASKVSKPKGSMDKIKASAAPLATQNRRKGCNAPVESPTCEDEEMAGGANVSANHNKYCHFCQHVKVRASSMLACENPECCRRFCEHCLLTHLNEDVDPMSSDAWSISNGKPVWSCPICRNKCCCSVTDCTADHRHCKAYRYRRRRAELASKRMAAVADKRVKKTITKPKTPTMARPTISLFGHRSSSSSSIDTPPAWASGSHLSDAWTSRKEAMKTHGGEEADSDVLSPVDSVVASPRDSVRNLKEARKETDALGIWQPIHDGGEANFDEGHPFFEEKEAADMEDGDQFGEMNEQDMFGSMYGHMCPMPDDYESAMSDVTSDLWSDPTLSSEKEFVKLEDGELDEAQWLRKTYETVYNPAARQRALQNLMSCIGGKAREAAVNDGPRKCTVMYDFV
mmetsp:Transcript_31042/g.99591  ORF Transcript_31042/g.99591 Transcript_31042/m.99591 type:complete len:426 (-) Transcript_31042:114-1391(-)